MSDPAKPAAPHEGLVARILDGTAPPQARSAAARGALPLPRPVLVRLYLHLRQEQDESIRRDAETSLAAIRGDAVREIVADPACPAEVLNHYAPAAARDEALAERLAFHPAVPEKALSVLASEGNASVIDLVLTNQERLLSTQGLLDKLTVNPALRPDQRARILDLLDTFFRKDASGGESGDLPAEITVDDLLDPEVAARILEVDVGELYAASEIMGGEEFEQAEDPRIRSVYRKILTLNTAQKAMLAMKGGREERMILVRDTNKVVALSVLKNGRLTGLEVEAIARMRNVSEEILRSVGTHREWSKEYTVVAELTRNPRTPPGISTNFVSRLNNKDLKMLSGDKNVPEIIRRMAKRTLETRTQQASPSFRKK